MKIKQRNKQMENNEDEELETEAFREKTFGEKKNFFTAQLTPNMVQKWASASFREQRRRLKK